MEITESNATEVKTDSIALLWTMDKASQNNIDIAFGSNYCWKLEEEQQLALELRYIETRGIQYEAALDTRAAKKSKTIAIESVWGQRMTQIWNT